MNRTAPPIYRPRQRVLGVSYHDGHMEVFADTPMDVRLVRVPVAYSRDAEAIAEECALLMIPPEFRELFRADWRRYSGSTRPLTASTALAALQIEDTITALNALQAGSEEVVTWTF